MHAIPRPTRPEPARLAATAALALIAVAGAACDDGPAGPGDRYRRLVPDIAVTGVSIFQSVEVPLFAGGAEVPAANAVVVAGKTATVGVYLEPGPTFDGREVIVALAMERDGVTRWIETPFVPSGPSTPERPDSLVRFPLAAEEVGGTFALAVAIIDPAVPAVAPTATHTARYPADGTVRPVPLGEAGAPVRLVLIPVRYARGGNEYLPDTSPAQIELYRSFLMATYPATDWDLVLHEEIYWDRPPGWGGFDFSSLNEYLTTLKAREGDVPESHYYALVAPAESFAAYCTPACVAGQSYLVTDAGMANLRVGAGIGFTGPDSAWTLVHELGHIFGRGHSGCSVPRDDREFPYAGGTIGVWGHDPRDGRFRPPSTPDFMGYCTNQWVADFTWNRLFERLRELADLGAKATPVRYRALHLDLDAGAAAWGDEMDGDRLPRADRIPAAMTGPDGPASLDLPVAWQSDGRHGTVLVPTDRIPALHSLPGVPRIPAP